MFKKKPQIKNLSPLRSSDRRKLADQIIAAYNVSLPQPPENGTAETTPAVGDTPSQAPTLTSVRASLIPETCLSARFTTHAGASATLVSGTVYVGAHPGQEERILWIQYGKDGAIYPTVYSLWHNPGLVPLLHTQDFVIEKLRTGADLMTPGLVGGPPWPAAAKKGSVVAVAGLDRDTVPVCVGICQIDISELGSVRGSKGAAVEGIHWQGDEIWNWSQVGSGGRKAPETVDGWEGLSSRKAGGETEAMERLDIDDDDDDEEGQGDGGVTLQAHPADSKNGQSKEESSQDHEEEQEPDHEPTTAEVDQAFQDAFVYFIYNAKKNGKAPHYGVDFPIQPSFLISNMVQPHLRVQNQFYNIKKTSWKNTKKFIKHLDKTALVKSKDRNGGETVILDVDFDDQLVKSFAPYRLPKPKTTGTDQDANHTDGTPASSGGGDPSIGQKLSLVTVYRASSALYPDLIPSKSSFYTSQQISAFLKKYIENDPTLTAETSSPRFVKMNPFIANNILGSNSSSSDAKVLAAGEIARDSLLRRVLDDDHLCIPHWLLLREGQSWDSAGGGPNPPTLKPKPGPTPTVGLVVDKRAGNKLVTRIGNLEAFGVNPNILGPELQRKCAGSASVSQLVGGKPGMLEVQVQGDQRDIVEKELARRGIDRRWIEVTDKTKKKSSGGAGGKK